MFDFPSSPSVGQIFAPTGGPSWVWDGTVWKNYQTQGDTQIVRTFIPGSQAGATTYVYNKPANLRHLEFEGVAAGGSGAPAIATGASVWSFGSGGGGGAWGKKLFNAAALPASVTITIGAPGAASSAGNGNTAADTTFGSLVTLPGGRAGSQGANTAYSSWGSVAGGAPTAYPTGVDVGRPGEGADGVSVSIAHSSAAGNVAAQVGRAGASPWGTVYYALYSTTGQSSGQGTGYGWGSGGSVNAGSAALRSSVAGGPGAVLLTEYLAVSSDAGDQQIITPWVQYTPVWQGLGAPTNAAIFSRRVGDSLEVRGRFTTGTVSAVEARMSLGYNGVEGGLLIDAAKVSAEGPQVAGNAIQNSAGVNLFYTLMQPSVGFICFGCQNAARSGHAKLNGDTMSSSTLPWSLEAKVPIAGWLAKVPAAPAMATRQTFSLAGVSEVNVTVPAGAQIAKITGKLYQPSATATSAWMRIAPDGVNFLAGASDYRISGFNVYGGSATSPAKVVQSDQNVFQLTAASDNPLVPHLFDCDLVVHKGATANVFTAKWRGQMLNNAATNLIHELYWAGYSNPTAGQPAQLGAFKISASTGVWAAGSMISVEWIY